jgi:hypothetical protein
MRDLLRAGTLLLFFLGAAACSSSSSSGATDAGTTGADAGPLPTIAITLAGDGGSPSLAVQHMTLSGKDATIVPVPFTLTDFTLTAPLMCADNTSDDHCGHLHIFVDDSACTPSGSPYDNDDATSSPAIAILSTCPTVDGMHTARLELHHGDHSPVLGADGMVIQASAAFTATGQ